MWSRKEAVTVGRSHVRTGTQCDLETVVLSFSGAPSMLPRGP